MLCFLFYFTCLARSLSIDLRGQLWTLSSESTQLGVSCDMRLLREGKQYRVFGRRRGYLKFSCWSVLRLQSCVYGQLPDLCRIKHFITRHLALLHKQNQHFDSVLTTPQPSKYQPRSPAFLS